MKIKRLTICLLILVFSEGCNSSSSLKNTHGTSIDTTNVVYTCPMHSEIRSNEPGSCPKCGMDLKKISKASDTTTKQ